MTSNLNCLQVNIGKGKTATSVLRQTCQESSVDLILIQDPYAIDGKILGLPMSAVVVCSSDSPKAAIVALNKKLQAISLYESSTLIVADVVTGDNCICFFSIYILPTDDIEDHLEKITDQIILNRGKKIILCGDFNSHHELWGSEHRDDRGTQMVDFLNSFDLFVENDPAYGPTFMSGNGASWIDLTINNMTLHSKVNDWLIVDDAMQ